jgi:hypothetical protein
MTFKRKSYLSKHICSCETKSAAPTQNLIEAPGEDQHPVEFILVQVKVKAENYLEFFEFMRQCPYIHQEDTEVPTMDPGTPLQTTSDTAAPACLSPPPAQTSINMSVDVLLSPEAQDYLDPMSIPMARDILDGPFSQAPDTFSEGIGCDEVWIQAPGEPTPTAHCTTVDMDLFSEFISNL